MNKHPGKIEFRFTQKEVYNADFRRFELLFGHLDRLLPTEKDILREFCGAVSITFDPKLVAEYPSALRHPAFHRFAKRFTEITPALPFLISLGDEGLMLIFLGSLTRLSHVKVDGHATERIGFERNEFGHRGGLLKDNAATWGKKAGMDSGEISDLRVALERYLVAPELSDKFGWNGAIAD